MEEQMKGPFCQSCSLPMQKPQDFGTDERGFRVNDYCHYCFQNGKFTSPDMTLQQMIDLSVSGMVKNTNIPEDQARELLTNFIPTLKRWTTK